MGIDLGLRAVVTTSDGLEVSRPRFYVKAEKRLKRLQRQFSNKKPGSNRRWKARKRVASQHAKVARQRADFNHKLSYRLVKEHDLIAIENLKVNNLVRNHSLAKAIHDAGWGQLVTFVEYKAAAKGCAVVKVDPSYSTQECCYCSTLNNVSLKIRRFVCCGCGFTLQRDVNAARVVLKRALVKVGQGMPELKPAKIWPLLAQPIGPGRQVDESGTKKPCARADRMSHRESLNCDDAWLTSS